MSQQKTPDFIGSSIYDLDGSLFADKINAAIAETAFAASINDDKRKRGRVTIEFGFERVGETSQLQVRHKLTTDRPTRRGKVISQDETLTPMYCNNQGKLTIGPDTQLDLIARQSRNTTQEII
jgi:hypothetical protein